MSKSAQMSMITIDDFIGKTGAVKTAEEAHTEPGSIGGETKHPVKNVDDRTEAAKEGARSAENTKDVKADQGEPAVDNTAVAKAASANPFALAARFAAGQKTAAATKKAEGAAQVAGSAEDDQLQIGTKKAPTGEDPAHETSSAKGGKEDGQYQGSSTHPARTDNDKLDGHKYASDVSLEKLAADMKTLGEDLCAAITYDARDGGATKQAAQRQSSPQAQQPTKQASFDPQVAHQAGWEMAALLNGTFDKQASDSLVVGTLEDVIKTASDDADNVAAYLGQYFAKQAEGSQEPPPDPAAMMGGGAGGGMPMGGAGGEEGGPMGAAGAPGGGGPEGMGGPGGDAGGPGGPGGGGGEEAQLQAILDQLGITPEQLMQMLAQEQAQGGGGGAPGGPGGSAPGGPMGGAGGAPMAGGGGPGGGGLEASASDRGGTTKQAASKQGGAKVAAADMRNYLTELVGRSRAQK